ncbi:polysaccharide deacetylase family protein [Sporosarcina sp. FSL K6-1522]|uniref:polysaccharide deacetylase family protein n=1 Tax=Sporosarcina sp. FSL K6-1522 TaxID=2921554 RepID=UPI00315A33FC
MRRIHRKRRSKWIDISFSIAIIAMTVAAIYLVTQTNKNQAASSASEKKTAAIPPTVETVDSEEYANIKIVTETSNDEAVPYTIRYPESLHSPFNDEVLAYVNAAKKHFITELEKQKKRDRQGKLSISFETLSHSSGNYSFVLINEQTIGDTPKSIDVQSFHLNTETGESLAIEHVITSEPQTLENLSTIIQNKLKEDPLLKDALSPDDVQAYTAPIISNFKNFAITDESLIFYFDEDTFTAASVGPPIVAIPLTEVNDLLAESFKIIDRSNEKQVALTFDDGPDPIITTQILETLNKYNAKATFFMLGNMAEKNPDTAKAVKDAGHELGNHSWSHPILTKLGPEAIRNEVNNTTATIENATGGKVTVFRPPYGAVNASVREQIGLPVIMWDVDTLDWKHRNANQLLTYVKNQTKAGSIVLMHDIHQSTADGLDAVMAYLQSEGYTFVTISEMNK